MNLPKQNSVAVRRLVKVMLPARVVRLMDSAVGGSQAYIDRAEFITDAIMGHLADLQEWDHAEPTPLHPDTDEPIKGADLSETSALASIPSLPDTVPTVERSCPASDTPTWGMHNRDFPTIWALWNLAAATGRAGEPIDLDAWLADLAAQAWDLKRDLTGDSFDTAGFPSNREKREASESRFVRFFVAAAPDEGPLFEFGMAGADGTRVAPTDGGLALLSNLQGLSCESAVEPRQEWTEAYLSYLASAAPADLKFMLQVIGGIRAGFDDRPSLLEFVKEAYPGWSGSVVETNAAGFIGRAREWGLLEKKQVKGRYRLTALGKAVGDESLIEGSSFGAADGGEDP